MVQASNFSFETSIRNTIDTLNFNSALMFKQMERIVSGLLPVTREMIQQADEQMSYWLKSSNDSLLARKDFPQLADLLEEAGLAKICHAKDIGEYLRTLVFFAPFNVELNGEGYLSMSCR